MSYSSSLRYGRSVGSIALRGETDSWSPITWVDRGYGWTVSEVSIPEEGLKVIGISERKNGRFSDLVEWGYARWLNIAEIVLDVDNVLEEDDVCIGLDLKPYEWVTGWEEEVNSFFDEFLDSRFRIPSAEEVEFKLDDIFG